MYKFSEKSIERMIGVKPVMIQVAELALSYDIMDATVLSNGGLRTVLEQRKMVKRGASKTMKSKHMMQSDGYGHALDLAPYPVDWNDLERFNMWSTLMFRAAAELNVVIEWGGHWRSFKDYPHFHFVRFVK